ncbi:glycosyltransferase family 4 protein [Tardiphaga sp.]|jgi:glycosyltransferase involved in cell wall biosynthesis|uniref:glycosyltransferase family 4 protein n=1 Tax=Tardiphaga sp. TaxID=1926292 RepID=UPI0037D9B335
MGADDAVGIPKSAKARRQAGSSLSRFTRLLASTGFAFGRPAAQVLPPHSIYLNVGQLLFFKPTVAWLAQRPDITSVVMLHDVIPIEHPTHHVKLGVHLHRAIVRNAIAFSDGLIVPTHFVRDSLVRVDRRFGELPIHVERLPVTAAFLARQKPDEDLQRVGYYLACGAIEAHKNHVVLLQAWKKWMEVDNAGVPRLIIAGKLSPTSEVVLDFLAKNPALERKVSVVSDLSTPAIRALMANAKAVLMPSIAEGFGLPIVEALAQGTMVVASDTPAHREAGESGLVIYTSPTDFQSWFTAIQSVEQNCGRSAGALSKRPYVAKTWETYFRSIEAFLDSTVAAKSKETTLIDSTLSRSASS